MKKLFSSLLLAFSVVAGAATSNEVALDKIVAVINSEVITESQLDHRIAIIKQQMQSAGAPLPTDAQMREQILQELINENVQLQIAKRNKVEVTNAQLNQALTNIAARNHLGLDQLKDAVEKQGLNYEAFRNQLHQQMIIAQVQQNAIGPIPVSDKEINDYLHQNADKNLQYHVQDLLVQLPDKPSAQQMQAAQKLVETLIRQLQQNPNQALPAGIQNDDLGWRQLNELPDVFVNRIAHMKVGEVAGPIQAPNGLHVIKLLEQRGAPQSITRQQVKTLLYQEKLEKQVAPWLKKVRSTAYIKIMN